MARANFKHTHARPHTCLYNTDIRIHLHVHIHVVAAACSHCCFNAGNISTGASVVRENPRKSPLSVWAFWLEWAYLGVAVVSSIPGDLPRAIANAIAVMRWQFFRDTTLWPDNTQALTRFLQAGLEGLKFLHQLMIKDHLQVAPSPNFLRLRNSTSKSPRLVWYGVDKVALAWISATNPPNALTKVGQQDWGGGGGRGQPGELFDRRLASLRHLTRQ